MNNNYMEKAFINKKNDSAEVIPQPKIIKISSDEKPNGLSQLCDQLYSLSKLSQDKNECVRTNFDSFLFCLSVSDVIKLQQWSRALCRLFNPEQMRRVVRVGNLDENLRAKFWIHQWPYFSYLNEVREKIGENDFFVNVYECILSRLVSDPINSKVVDEIGRDLPRTFTCDKILAKEGLKQLK